MPGARGPAGGLLVASMACAMVALAQPHGKPAKAPAKPRPAASSAPDNPYDENAAPTSGAPLGAVDGGPAATAPAQPVDGGSLRKASPLTPAPEEFPDAGPPSAPLDYEALLAEIAALRARISLVSDALFRARLQVSVESHGDHAKVAGLTVLLDDGAVWTSPRTFGTDQVSIVYDHAVAPGLHTVAVDVDRRDDRGQQFSSTQRSRFAIEVPAEEKLLLQIELWDDSNMGGFSQEKTGQYDLRVRARARTRRVDGKEGP
jgi:hypothetical protein